MEDYKYSLDIMEQEIENKYISSEIQYAFNSSIEAIKKQIPKAIEYDRNGQNECPICKSHVYTDDNYCFNCGQRIFTDLN